MSSALYQTFYPYNKFDDGNSIQKLEKWMLSKDVLMQLFTEYSGRKAEELRENLIEPSFLTNHIVETSTISDEDRSLTVDTIPLAKRNEYFSKSSEKCSVGVHHTSDVKRMEYSAFLVPDKMDTLFWCLYISHYGESTYLAIGNKYGNAEIAERQKIMEFLKSNKYILKNIHRKITLGATQEIMSDLMTNMKTSLLSLWAFSLYYKKNIILLNSINKTFLEYNTMPEETGERKWLVIKYTSNKKYGFFADEITDLSDYITHEYIRIESPDKPLKGISTYKIGELLEISSKMPGLTNKSGEVCSTSLVSKEAKLSKPELYGKLWQHLLWV